MNHYTEKTGPDGNRQITTVSPTRTNPHIVSLTVLDKGEVMFMDTDLERCSSLLSPQNTFENPPDK